MLESKVKHAAMFILVQIKTPHYENVDSGDKWEAEAGSLSKLTSLIVGTFLLPQRILV